MDLLASEARANLRSMPWVDVRHGDGTGSLGETFDAVFINAGVTHPLDMWLDALAPGGRMVVPVTGTMPSMNTIGKGYMLLFTNRSGDSSLDARAFTFVGIYSAVGLRDEALNEQIGKALMRSSFQLPAIKRLRRDPHGRHQRAGSTVRRSVSRWTNRATGYRLGLRSISYLAAQLATSGLMGRTCEANPP